jgi:type II secretory pathway pseudopilin PulG
MSFQESPEKEPSRSARRSLTVALVVLLVVGTGLAAYFIGHRGSSANGARAEQRGAQLAQVQDQLRSAAKQNDYLAEQVRQGTRALSNAGSDSQSAQRRFRKALRRERKVEARMKAKQERTAAKLHGLSSGLKGSLGTVSYIPPAHNGGAGSVQGSMTISNSAGTPLDAVCVVTVGGVRYAIMSTGVPSKGSVVESFQFPYSGPKPSGATSGGCGRL